MQSLWKFLGPIAVAALGNKSFRSATSLFVAGLGVFLLARVTSEGTFVGVLFALAAGGVVGTVYRSRQ